MTSHWVIAWDIGIASGVERGTVRYEVMFDGSKMLSVGDTPM